MLIFVMRAWDSSGRSVMNPDCMMLLCKDNELELHCKWKETTADNWLVLSSSPTKHQSGCGPCKPAWMLISGSHGKRCCLWMITY